MAQTFEYSLVGDLESKFEQIKVAAAAKGISFVGDHDGGYFSGMGLRGTYAISGSQIAVEITAKPIFVSWAYIDSQLRGFIEG